MEIISIVTEAEKGEVDLHTGSIAKVREEKRKGQVSCPASFLHGTGGEVSSWKQ